jgi:hypothetical protein
MPWVPVCRVPGSIVANVIIAVDVSPAPGVSATETWLDVLKSVNWTLPVGAAPPFEDTVAVNVTESLTWLGFSEDVRLVVVATCACAVNAGRRNAPASSATVPIERQ